jgi:hypothetical protein
VTTICREARGKIASRGIVFKQKHYPVSTRHDRTLRLPSRSLDALDKAAVDGIDADAFVIVRRKQRRDGGSKMKPVSGKHMLRIFSFLAVLLSTMAPGQSRQWAHNPTDLASDYLTINDNRGGGEIVLIMWLAAPRFAKGPTQDMLNKYVVIGVAHAHTSKEGTMSFDRTATLDAANAQGN